MDGALEVPQKRVNASMLRPGAKVCFVGRVEQVQPSGKSFTMSDAEGKHVTVEMHMPLSEMLSGVVEVIGNVTNRNNLQCLSYIQFPEDRGKFDMNLYNDGLKILQDFPEHYMAEEMQDF
uniref:replication protein A 14 kDa subunit n=1 Tax=Myxine glutinosa TaxID=7769 RepID=UPI00358E22BC